MEVSYELLVQLESFISRSAEIHRKLNEVKEQILKHNKNHLFAKTTGTTATAIGTGLGIAGLLLAPATLGASAVFVSGAGVATSLLGAGTNITADIVKGGKNDAFLKEIEKLAFELEELTKTLLPVYEVVSVLLALNIGLTKEESLLSAYCLLNLPMVDAALGAFDKIKEGGGSGPNGKNFGEKESNIGLTGKAVAGATSIIGLGAANTTRAVVNAAVGNAEQAAVKAAAAQAAKRTAVRAAQRASTKAASTAATASKEIAEAAAARAATKAARATAAKATARAAQGAAKTSTKEAAQTVGKYAAAAAFLKGVAVVAGVGFTVYDIASLVKEFKSGNPTLEQIDDMIQRLSAEIAEHKKTVKLLSDHISESNGTISIANIGPLNIVGSLPISVHMIKNLCLGAYDTVNNVRLNAVEASDSEEDNNLGSNLDIDTISSNQWDEISVGNFLLNSGAAKGFQDIVHILKVLDDTNDCVILESRRNPASALSRSLSMSFSSSKLVREENVSETLLSNQLGKYELKYKLEEDHYVINPKVAQIKKDIIDDFVATICETPFSEIANHLPGDSKTRLDYYEEEGFLSKEIMLQMSVYMLRLDIDANAAHFDLLMKCLRSYLVQEMVAAYQLLKIHRTPVPKIANKDQVANQVCENSTSDSRKFQISTFVQLICNFKLYVDQVAKIYWLAEDSSLSDGSKTSRKKIFRNHVKKIDEMFANLLTTVFDYVLDIKLAKFKHDTVNRFR